MQLCLVCLVLRLASPLFSNPRPQQRKGPDTANPSAIPARGFLWGAVQSAASRRMHKGLQGSGLQGIQGPPFSGLQWSANRLPPCAVGTPSGGPAPGTPDRERPKLDSTLAPADPCCYFCAVQQCSSGALQRRCVFPVTCTPPFRGSSSSPCAPFFGQPWVSLLRAAS